MIQVSVIHDHQRDQLSHSDGALFLGRRPPEECACIVLVDQYVSRDQIQIEEFEAGRIRVQNRGQALVTFADGTTITKGESSELELPVRLSIGETIIDIEVATGDKVWFGNEMTVDTGETINLTPLIHDSVTNYFPYPLAFGFRLTRSITNAAELYKEQLRLAENVLAFVASVSLALLDDEQRGHVNEKVGGSALSSWQGGISPGDWLTLAIHATGQFQNADAGPLRRGLNNLQVNKGKHGFGKFARELIEAKNDYKHDRGPSIEAEYRAASDSVGEILAEVFEFLAFLSNHRILLVQEAIPRQSGDGWDAVFLNCMGDHPGFDTEWEVHAQDLRVGDLYIEQQSGQLVSLSPFVHATICSQCKAREFYFLDRLSRDRSGEAGAIAGLKSFERGHTEQDRELGDELLQRFGGTIG